MPAQSKTEAEIAEETFAKSLQAAEKALTEARLACEGGRYEGALASLSLSRTHFGAASQTIPGRDEIQAGLEKCKQVEADIRQAKARKLKDEAQRAEQNGDYTTAREQYIRAQELSPSPEVQTRLEQLKVLEERDQELNNLATLARSFEERNDYLRAVDHYERATKLAEERVSAVMQVAVQKALVIEGLQDNKTFLEASSNLDHAESLGIPDEHTRRYVWIARQLLRAKRSLLVQGPINSGQEAHMLRQSSWEDYLRRQDTRAEGRVRVGWEALERGDYEAALHYALEALDLEDTSESVRIKAQRLSREAKEYSGLAQRMAALIEKAEYHLNAGEYERAIQILVGVQWVNHERKVKQTLKARRMLDIAHQMRRQQLEEEAEPVIRLAQVALRVASRVADCDAIIAQANGILKSLPSHAGACALLEEASEARSRFLRAEELKQRGEDALRAGDHYLAHKTLTQAQELNPRDAEIMAWVAQVERQREAGIARDQRPSQTVASSILAPLLGLAGAVLGAALEPTIQSWFKEIGLEPIVQKVPRAVVVIVFALAFAIIIGGGAWLVLQWIRDRKAISRER